MVPLLSVIKRKVERLSISRAGRGIAPRNGPTIEDPIEALLADLKSIMVKHLSGDYNEKLCYAVIFAISSLEKDIKQHNRIRYRILTPMVSAMEKLCI